MAAKNAFYNLLHEYEEGSIYELLQSSDINSFTLSSAIANNLDYNLIYASQTTDK